VNEFAPYDSNGLVNRAELVELLASALGETKAAEVIRQAALDLRIPNGQLTQQQALSVLDRVAFTPGLVGISARFVKSRLILRWGNPT
jgi:hypothetical protein